ncbi:group II intron reverse transcriptase/maturase [Paenibacillus melissococcoides]|uniref:RNA-directed DNA polymerase n=2 Tax=Paenibacillus TaxID=44249 RepID=A0ABM9G2N4_9BACL|nr:group II intron reverse transcriptase/maturase [Paenibacillus melissococcoides]CAH8245799.1 group II intron reverse transcriptase/maturase [Paenibacillus melissococcoides]CAH8712120.1 group II intron reverse transcriptase/maturase [Paenibacillus melissococcoides]CAH8712864.1 group II intron reverse transcriptase/maturase [Paenibacillus melissococcoides]
MNAQKANYAKVKAQQLQNVLYLAAKENPRRRFHALYDKVHRGDILWEAWKRVKAKGGSGGVDGITIDHIVKEFGEERFVDEIQGKLRNGKYHPQPARRKEIPKPDGKMRPLGIPVIRDRVVQMATKMVIEPVFEADFKDCSYGFRPKRSQHDAIRHIRRAVKKGVYWVVDIDITGYFDNIPHEKLMRLVEQRISDRRVLQLIRKWLKAGFVKDDQFHETDLGSPQGGVISPLLANIYLNYLDTIWEKKFAEAGTLVRYADDLVILCKTKEQALRAIDVLKAVFGKLELEMNKTKSKLVNLWGDKEGFDFLGMHHRKIPRMMKRNKEVHVLRSYPSKKAMKNMKQKVKEATEPRNRLFWTMNRMVDELNPKIQGWRNYYGIDSFADQYLNKIDWYIRKRLTLFWNKKRSRRNKHSNSRQAAIAAQLAGLKKLAN